MKKGFFKCTVLITIIAMFATLFTGCGGGKADEAASSDIAKVKDTLTVAMHSDAKSLDPAATNDLVSANAMTQIYETLVKMNEKNEIVPMLAESFNQVDDVTYEFKLLKGVKFHNGEEMKASDVKFSIERAAQSPTLAYIFGDVDLTSFQTPDDYTISFKLKKVNTTFLPALTFVSSGIVSEKAVKDAGDTFAMNPVGTGPFKLSSWTKGDNIKLERFDDFHGDKPVLTTITLRVIPEPTNRVIELESGGVDLAYQIVSNDVKRIQENPELKAMNMMDTSTTFLGMNNSKKPFDDVRVRQAVSYAIDTTTAVDTVCRGVGKVASGPFSPTLKYYDKSLTPHEYNVEKAKELLKEAGYPDGFKVKISTNDKKERVDLATVIQSQLSEVGIQAEISVVEWGAYLSSLYKGESEMFMIGWGAQIPDPDSSLYAPFHSSMKGNGGNMAFFGDPRVDELLEKGRTMKDSPEREQVYFEIQKLIKEQAPWVFILNGEVVYGMNKNIEGFNPSPFGFNALYNISFK